MLNGQSTQGERVTHGARAEPAAVPSSGAAHLFSLSTERLLLGRMLADLGHPALELVLWDGQAVSSPRPGPLHKVPIRDRRTLLRLLADPARQLGQLRAGTDLNQGQARAQDPLSPGQSPAQPSGQ